MERSVVFALNVVQEPFVRLTVELASVGSVIGTDAELTFYVDAFPWPNFKFVKINADGRELV